MRFTSSQTSFRSGRLSPKLYNRVDTQQYKDGASVMEAVRVLPEGGIERLRGTRKLNPPTTVDTIDPALHVASTSFSYKCGDDCIIFTIYQFLDNSVYLYGTRLEGWDASSAFLDDWKLIGPGATEYPLDQFSWAFSDGYLIITHFSGTMAPIYVPVYEGMVSFAASPPKRLKRSEANQDSSNTVVTPDGIFSRNSSGYVSDPFLLPMSDIGEVGSNITLTAGAGTDLTLSASSSVLRKLPLGSTKTSETETDSSSYLGSAKSPP
jgi:hypothetical protein